MNFIKISNDFLLNYGDYRNDVNNFIYYLSEEMKIDLNSESNWVTFQGIDVKFLKVRILQKSTQLQLHNYSII